MGKTEETWRRDAASSEEFSVAGSFGEKRSFFGTRTVLVTFLLRFLESRICLFEECGSNILVAKLKLELDPTTLT